jgi:hypothetical protein
LYKKLFQQVDEKNVRFNVVIGEFGFGQAKVMKQLLSKNFDQRWAIEKDLAGIDRYFIIKNRT